MNKSELENKLAEFVKNAIYEMEDSALNVQKVTEEIPEYDPDWCAESPFAEYDKALDDFVKAEVDTYLYYYSENEE